MRFNIATAVVALFIASFCSLAQADLRADATSMLTKLKQEGAAGKLPDELRSLDATIATADMYFHLRDTHNADKYYRMAIQKATVIQSRLDPATNAATSPHTPDRANTAPPRLQSSVTSQNQNSHNHKAIQSEPGNSPSSNAVSTPSSTSKANEDVSEAEDLQEISSDRLVEDPLNASGLARKLGVSRAQLAAMNRLSPNVKLKQGQELKYNNRRIIPDQKLKDGIVINIPDRMLYYFQKEKLVFATAVALGTPGKTGKYVWHTPAGKFRIISREKDPTWTVPPSIQEEMKLEGKEIIKSVPPGPGNPLGKYAMKTSLPGILIHSTSKPWSIYTYASHGCIRVYPQKMEELFKIVKVNTPGEIIYRPVKAAVTEQGKVFLEIHPDIYSKTKGLEKETKAILESMNLTEKVDWTKVKKALTRKSGVAEDVSLETVEAQKEQPVAKTQSPS